MALAGSYKCPWGSQLLLESWLSWPSWRWPVIASERYLPSPQPRLCPQPPPRTCCSFSRLSLCPGLEVQMEALP